MSNQWIAVVAALALALVAQAASASGTLGIYGIVEKVVFEPDASAPERVRVYGVFALYNHGRSDTPTTWITGAPTVAERGYLYFTLPNAESRHAAARREWGDLAAVAGTGEAVAFAGYGHGGVLGSGSASADVYIVVPLRGATVERNGGNAEILVTDGTARLEVWPESASATPVHYSTTGSIGVVKLGEGNHADVIAKLRALSHAPR